MNTRRSHLDVAGLPTDVRAVLEPFVASPPEQAAMVENGSFLTAISSGSGRLCWESPAFVDVVGDPSASADCRALVARALQDGRASGLVATPARGSVVVEASCPSAKIAWPLSEGARDALAENGD